ncbi:MAG: DedA family protein [Acidimicrobiales bacterium]
MSGLVDKLGVFSDPVLLMIVVAFIIAESGLAAGIVLPGEAVLILGGYLTAAGRFNLALLLAVSTTAAIVGDSLGYLCGDRTLRLLQRTPVRRWITPQKLDRTRRRVADERLATLVAGRFVGPIRALLPSVSGAIHIPYRRVLAYSVTSATIWAPTVILAGYFAHDWVQRWGSTAIGALTAALVSYLALRTLRRRRVERTRAKASLNPQRHNSPEPDVAA